MMKKLVILSLAALPLSPVYAVRVDAPAPPPPAEPVKADPAAIAAVDRLLASSGAEANYRNLVPKMIETLAPQLSKENAGREDEIRQILVDEMSDIGVRLWPEIREKMRGIYLQRFSASELQELERFNQSPLGQKVSREMPAIQFEMMKFGAEAGRAAVMAAFPRIFNRMRAAKLRVPAGV